MGVNFSHLEIGRRALRASQMGLTITGQNIANVDTPGYTRQAVEISATPIDLSDRQLVVAGVTIEGVRSYRDRFVEARIQRETAIAGRLTAQRDALAPVDTAFDESEGGGISSAMASFFGGFRDLEAYPTSVPLRAVAAEKGAALASAFHATASRLQHIRGDTDARLRSVTEDVNSFARQIAALNVQV
ncbi:MAG: FlgK family flagellar hook-associated protein, partial [Pyrinomonadaceae bacterium]